MSINNTNNLENIQLIRYESFDDLNIDLDTIPDLYQENIDLYQDLYQENINTYFDDLYDFAFDFDFEFDKNKNNLEIPTENKNTKNTLQNNSVHTQDIHTQDISEINDYDQNVCFVCNFPCNPNSQTCGSCARKITGASLGWNINPVIQTKNQ